MEKIIVQGGASLQGRVTVSGAKNAVLPIITAALLADEPCRLFDVPDLADVDTICEVLRNLGARVERGQEKEIIVAAQVLNGNEPPYDAVRKMRASFLVMGPLLARTGQARISLPGGCPVKDLLHRRQQSGVALHLHLTGQPEKDHPGQGA